MILVRNRFAALSSEAQDRAAVAHEDHDYSIAWGFRVSYGSSPTELGSRHAELRTSQAVRFVPILLQKSVGCDGRSTFSFGAAGLDPPPLTPSAQLQRYAMHRASAGGGRAASAASRRRFWAIAARSNSSWAPLGPRSLSRPSLRMRFKCANRISIFLRIRQERSRAASIFRTR
jgi:hypothetical protein